jgi:hypothetical protein
VDQHDGLISPQMLAQHQLNPGQIADTAALRGQIAEIDRRIANLPNAIELGGDQAALADQLARRSTERKGLETRLRQKAGKPAWSDAQMAEAL